MQLIVVLSAIALVYALAHRLAPRPGTSAQRVLAGLAGLLSLGLTLSGPLDSLAETSFAAHMSQHLVQVTVAPLLIALGQPGRVLFGALSGEPRRRLLRLLFGGSGRRRLLFALAHPITVALLANGALLGWHLPLLYQLALRERGVHDLQHMSFLGGALLLWSTLLGSELPRRRRWSTSAALLVLFATWMVSDLLGATLTFSEKLFYPTSGLEGASELQALADQRLGGLLMWVGGGAFYAGAMGWLLISASRHRTWNSAPIDLAQAGRPT